MRTILITKPDPHLIQKVEDACKGGIDAVQLRDKEMEGRDLFELAKAIRLVTHQHQVQLFINSRPDIALAVGADGVHLPEHMFFPTFIKTGASCHSVEGAKQRENEGASYLFYSPIFASPGKGAPVGLEGLKSFVKQTSLPVYALGGITPETIPAILETGAYGVAAISAILDAPDVQLAAEQFATPFKKPKFQFKGVLGLVSTFDAGKAAIQEGVDGLQFRHKGPVTENVFSEMRQLRALCLEANIPFFINDRVDLVKILDATGVHLGQTDLPVKEARRILGPYKIIGATSSNPEEAKRAESEGADYIGLGAVFPTTSKIKITPPIGLEMVRSVKKVIRIPLIAIGGINEINAPSVFAAGADGIAVLSQLSRVLAHA